MRDTFIHTAEGMLSAALGTMFIDLELAQSAKLPDHLKPTKPYVNPGRWIARKVSGERLSEKQLDTAGHVLHWAYGVGWGALLGALSDRLCMRSLGRALLAGVGLGTAVWAVGYAGWLPASRLTPPVTRQGAKHMGASLITHIGYGLATALPLCAMRFVEDKVR